MKHKYLFVPDAEHFSANSMYYIVWAGSSQRDQAKVTLLDCYSCDTGGFFRIWDEDTEMWLAAKFRGLFSGSSRLVEIPLSLEINVSECYKAVIDGTLAMRKNPPHVTRNHCHLLSRLSPSFFCSARSAQRNHSPFPFSRINLSELKQSEHARVAGLFCLILIIFLLSGYLEGVERWMYQ